LLFVGLQVSSNGLMTNKIGKLHRSIRLVDRYGYTPVLMPCRGAKHSALPKFSQSGLQRRGLRICSFAKDRLFLPPHNWATNEL
jgi:hypothetical protein